VRLGRSIGGGLQGAAIGAEDRGIEGIGLGELAGGLGKGAHARGIEHRDGDAVAVAEVGQRTVITTGGFHAEVGMSGPLLVKKRAALGVIGDAQRSAGEVSVEVEFADFDADVDFWWG
jgi:hypothetical protein